MSKVDQINKFWNEADFGYVKNIKDSIYPICQSEKEVRQIDPYLYCCIGYWLLIIKSYTVLSNYINKNG